MRDEIAPSWWPNAVQAFLSSAYAGFAVTKFNATTIQVVAGAGDDLVAIAIKGKWRYIEATIQQAHPGGGAATYDVFVTCAENAIDNIPAPNTDHTNFAFALQIKAAGVFPTIVPGTVDFYRKVGTLQWDGAQITSIAQTAGVSPLVAHAAAHRAGGTDEMSHAVLAAQAVLEVGQLAQLKAGRDLAVVDFTTLCGLPSTPAGLFNLAGLTNLGTGGALVNKGTVPFGVGVGGVASTAAVFSGSTLQALYIVDTGAADPFRIKTGSWGCWLRTAKRATQQVVVSKLGAAGQVGYRIDIGTGANVAQVLISLDGTVSTTVVGVTDVCDDRWHHVVATFDGGSLRVYVDGVLESTTVASGLIFGSSGPLNIGGQQADGGAVAAAPMFGRVDEAFVTADVLSDEQVRLLYCAKLAHGFAVTPTRAFLAVRRQRRGAPLVSADFPSQPVRLHNFTAGALTDAGSGAVALTNNGAAVAAGGADGTKDGAFNFVAASSQSLSSTDAGLPAGTATRSYGCWFKTGAAGSTVTLMAWGTTSTNDARADILNGALRALSGGDIITGPFVADGVWHLLVVVEDNAAADFKRKAYVDGRLVGGSTVLTSLTGIGANGFRVGAAPNATAFFTGQIDAPFVHSAALTPEQILTLYNKGAQALAASQKDASAHVEAFDATNIYAVFDELTGPATVDLAVAA